MIFMRSSKLWNLGRTDAMLASSSFAYSGGSACGCSEAMSAETCQPPVWHNGIAWIFSESDVQAAVTRELCMLARSGLLQYGCCSATAAATEQRRSCVPGNGSLPRRCISSSCAVPWPEKRSAERGGLLRVRPCRIRHSCTANQVGVR